MGRKYVIGTGRTAARQTALDFGAQEFVDLDNDAMEDIGKVDLFFDVLGGDFAKRSAGVIRLGGTLVTVTGPTEARPTGGLTIDFVVEADRAQLARSCSGSGMVACGQTSATWQPSTMPLRPLAHPNG